MTKEQSIQYRELVHALWDGQCGQEEFFTVGAGYGVSLEILNRDMDQVREEDGTWA